MSKKKDKRKEISRTDEDWARMDITEDSIVVVIDKDKGKMRPGKRKITVAVWANDKYTDRADWLKIVNDIKEYAKGALSKI